MKFLRFFTPVIKYTTPKAAGSTMHSCRFRVADNEKKINHPKLIFSKCLKSFNMNRKATRVNKRVNTSGKNVLLSDSVNGLNAKHTKTIKRKEGLMLNSFKILSNTMMMIIKLMIDIALRMVNENPNSLMMPIPAMYCGMSGIACQSENLNTPEFT